jgi:hypothetical protein
VNAQIAMPGAPDPAHQAVFPTVDANGNRTYSGTLRAVLPGQDSPLNFAQPESISDLRAITALTSLDSIVLTAGTATFYPVTPQPEQYVNGGNQFNAWGANIVPDGWVPVFLQQLDASVEVAGDFGQIDYYRPAYLDPKEPFVQGQFLIEPLEFLQTMLGTTLPSGLPPVGMEYGEWRNRWPLRLRATMYVSGNTTGFEPGQSRDFLNQNPANGIQPARALFEWDGEDGLENGDYDVYVVTFDKGSPLFRTEQAVRALDPDPLNPTFRYLTPFGLELLSTLEDQAADQMPLDIEFFSDRDASVPAGTPPSPINFGPDRRCWIDGINGGLTDGYPQLLEFDRSDGVRQGDSFGPVINAFPDEDGIIYYGRVRVENNYLAMLLTNWADDDGTINAFSRVVLAPRPRTYGKINLNTVLTKEVPRNTTPGGNHQWFSALMGLPGVMGEYDVLADLPDYFSFASAWDVRNRSAVPAPTDPTTSYPIPNRWDPNVSLPQAPALLPIPGLVPDVAATAPGTTALAAHGDFFNRARRMQALRYTHPDGRYYTEPADLVTPTDAAFPGTLAYTPTLSNIDVTFDPDLGYQNWDTRLQAQFRETTGRFNRIANLVTTRSDVFEIIVTAQTGYLSTTDLNNDGRIDYRNDFVVTGEKKIRTVYER